MSQSTEHASTETRPLVKAEITTYSPEAYVLTDTRSGTQWVIKTDRDDQGYWAALPNTEVTDEQVRDRNSAVLKELPAECMITKTAKHTCQEFIGGFIPGTRLEWDRSMCCAPCRVRMAMEGR